MTASATASDRTPSSPVQGGSPCPATASANARTRQELRALPDARFESFAALLWALERAQARARAA